MSSLFQINLDFSKHFLLLFSVKKVLFQNVAAPLKPDTVCSAKWPQGQVLLFWEKHVRPSATLTSKQPLVSLTVFPGSVYKKCRISCLRYLPKQKNENAELAILFLHKSDIC